MKEEKCICKCGRNIIEDEHIAIVNEGTKEEEHLCLECVSED